MENSKVDFFFEQDSKWQDIYKALRKIMLGCQLSEELKWGVPCYTIQKGNVVLIHGFKEYCALLFFKGALWSDTDGILVQQTTNVQAGRQVRFTNIKEVMALKPIIKAYTYEAIEIEKAGLKVELKKTTDFDVPEEFEQKLNDVPRLRAAFEALTPGRQRAYLFYFSQAKQAKTRIARVEKHITKILDGKGLED